MPLKDIQLYLRAGGANARRLAYAADLARDSGARVAGLCLVSEPDLPFFDDFAIGPDAVAQALTQRDAAIAALVAPTEAAFRTAMAAAGDTDWEVANIDTVPTILARRARLADLSIVGWRPVHDHAERALAEALVLHGATPCLTVPETRDEPGDLDRVVVAWDGSREAVRSLHDSLPLLARAKAVEVVVVAEPDQTLCDAASLGQLLNHLLRHGVSATRRRLSRSARHVGEDLLRACDDFSADLLVMGAFGHGAAAERVFGGATRWVLAESVLPVLLSH